MNPPPQKQGLIRTRSCGLFGVLALFATFPETSATPHLIDGSDLKAVRRSHPREVPLLVREHRRRQTVHHDSPAAIYGCEKNMKQCQA